MLYNMDEALPAIWASMASWCTPTVLFIVINLVIGTIFFSTRSSGEPNPGHTLARTASNQLPRLKSLNHLFRQRTEEIRAISALLSPEPELPPAELVAEKTNGQDHVEETHLERSASEKPEKVVKEEVEVKMKKSTSMSTKMSSMEDGVRLVKRPATTRAAPAREDDVGVDAKADDFINRFKQQLKLQRLDSLIRYKEMINRGKY